MAQKAYGLSHTKWMCKYHVVFTPKYRRKVIYNQIRSDLGEIFRKLCQYKGIEIIEGHLMPDHVHMLLAIPPKYSVSSVMGYLKGKSSLMVFDRHANMKYKFGNRKFWAEGYYVSTVGLNEATIAKYIREQEKADIALDRLSVKEHEDPFDRGPGANSAGLTGPSRVNLQCGPNPVRAGAFRRVPETQGLYPKSKPPLLGVVFDWHRDAQCCRAVHRLLDCRCMKKADIPPRGGGGNTPSRRRGAERGRVSTDDVAHRQDHCSAWRFLVYRVERLRCAIACGNGVLHSCTAEWARRSRDVLLAVRVRKVRAPEGGMPANGRAE